MLPKLMTLTALGLFTSFSLADNLPERPKRERGHDPLLTSSSFNVVPFDQPMVVLADGSLVAEQGAETPVQVAEVEDQVSEDAAPVRWVLADRVNVRGGPSTDFDVLGQVEFADAVLVVADQGDGWARIRIEGDGIEGFMASRFLQDEPPV